MNGLEARAEAIRMPGREPPTGSRPVHEQGRAERPPPREVIRFASIGSIKHEPLQAVIADYLFCETVNGLIGASGTCKSFIATHMACSVGTGTPWFGNTIEGPGAVFYLPGEGGRLLHKRFEGWSRHHQVSLQDAPIFIADRMPPLHEQLAAAGVVETIKRLADDLFFRAGGIEPRLIIIDTIARAMAGADENSASDVGRLVDAMDWLKSQWPAAVLGVHHTGHGAETKTRGRGSSALYAGLDGEYLVTSDGDQVRLRTTKAKDWQAPPELFFDRHLVEWTVEGRPESTLVLVPAGKPIRSVIETRERVAELREQGKSVRDIAKILGISESAAGRHAQAVKYEEMSGGR